MTRIALALCSFILVGCATTRPPAITGPAWLAETESAPKPTLEGRHVIFVAGFLNELIPGYFDDNVMETKQLGGSASVIRPPSGDSLERDVQRITDELSLRPGVKSVLFGHSKGGAAVLLTVLEHPELILNGDVDYVVVLQGAVGGSPLADGLAKVRPLRSAGLKSLTTEVAQATFASALRSVETLSPDDQTKLYSRIFYVRSAHNENQVAAELSLGELLLRAEGANDGLMPAKDMKLRVGVDLGLLDADHAALTVSSFLSVSTADERRNFTRALYREVGRRLRTAP